MIIPEKIVIPTTEEQKNKLVEIIDRLPGFKRSKIYSMVLGAGIDAVLDRINARGELNEETMPEEVSHGN